MKKEELFDLLEDVDRKYIGEAMFDDLDDYSSAVARPGKSRITPLKIIAPIAACMAVFAAAGFMLANSNRGRPAVEPATSIEESTENSETGDTQIIGTGIDDTKRDIPVAYDKAFVEKCKSIIRSENELIAQSDAASEVEWQVEMGDVDLEDLNHDGFDAELLICPRINNEAVTGVRVFKRDSDGNALDLGSFGEEFGNMSIEVLNCVANYDPDVSHVDFIYDFLNYSTIYYYNNTELDETCIESIQEIWLDKDTKKLREKTYLRLVKTYPADASSSTPLTETAYRYGSEIDVKELLDEWRRISDIPHEYFPKPGSASIAHLEATECVRLLVDKYDVPLNGGSPASLHHIIRTFDINMDGKNETVLEFKDCKQLPGIYVFSFENDNPRLIGELDLIGESGQYQQALYNGTVIERIGNDIRKFDDGNERFYFYRSSHDEKCEGEDGYKAEAGRGDINKIVVNEDGTLGIEVILSDGAEVIYGARPGTRAVYRINGENVTQTQAWEERQRLMNKSTAVPYK